MKKQTNNTATAVDHQRLVRHLGRGAVAMQFWPSERPVKRPKIYMVSRTMARALETGRWDRQPYLRILDDRIYPALGLEWVGVGCCWNPLPNAGDHAAARGESDPN